MKSIKTFLFILIFCFFCRVSFAGDVKFAYISILDYLPVISACENNNNNFNGTKIILEKFWSWTSMEAAFSEGIFDICLIPVPLALKLKANSNDIRILSAFSTGGSRLISKKTTISKLKDPFLAVFSIEASENLFLYDFNNKQSFFGDKMRILEISIQDFLNDYTDEYVDGVFCPEPYASILEDKKLGAELKEVSAIMKNKISMVLVVNNKFLNSNKSDVINCIEAFKQGINFVNEDIKKTGGKEIAKMQKKYFDFDEAIIIKALEHSKDNLEFKYIIPDKEQMMYLYDISAVFNFITKSVDFDELIEGVN